MRTSEQIDELAAALVDALGQLDDITKGSTADTGSYRYSYADLAAIYHQARPALAAHGLVALQEPFRSDDGRPAVRTRIIHRSGQWIESGGTPVSIGRNAGPQDDGSAYTYARRYDLLPMLGLATEDDDGRQAQRQKQAEQYVDEQLAERVRTVQADMKRLTDTGKEALRVWADGRKLSGHALVTDPQWLEQVESWIDEHHAISQEAPS